MVWTTTLTIFQLLAAQSQLCVVVISSDNHHPFGNHTGFRADAAQVTPREIRKAKGAGCEMENEEILHKTGIAVTGGSFKPCL